MNKKDGYGFQTEMFHKFRALIEKIKTLELNLLHDLNFEPFYVISQRMYIQKLKKKKENKKEIATL